jgi:hypothetical protein
MIIDKQENTSNSDGSDSRCESNKQPWTRGMFGVVDIVGTPETVSLFGKSFYSREGTRSDNHTGW